MSCAHHQGSFSSPWLEGYLAWASVALRRKGFSQLMLPRQSVFLEVMAGPDAEAMQYCSLSLISEHLGPPGVALPTVNWPLLCPSRKCIAGLCKGRSRWEVPFSQVTVACFELT